MEATTMQDHVDHEPAALAVVPAADLPAPVEEPGPLDRHPAAMYLAHLAPGAGRVGMQSTLRVIAAMLGFPGGPLAVPWSRLRFQHVAALRGRLVESGRSPATVNKCLAAVRGVMRQSWLLGEITAEEHARIRAVANVRGSRLPAGRALDVGELSALFRACADDTPAGARDAAAFALMFGCGLRRAEAVAVTLADVDAESGTVRVLGKGGKQREGYLANGGLVAMRRWLAERGDAPGPVLSPVDKAGRVFAGRPMTAQSIRMRLRRRARQAKIAECSPHDLRRSFISSALDAGADVVAIQHLVGHASPTTTSRYDRRPAEARRRAAALVHVPVA